MIGFFMLASVLQIVALSDFTNAQDRVNAIVYYETLCPYARKFIVDQLGPFLQGDLAPFISLTLVPYGKANTIVNDDGSYAFTCHHKAAECHGNLLQGCALTLFNLGNNTENLGYNKGAVEYIICLMKDLSPSSSIADVDRVSDACSPAEQKDTLKNCPSTVLGKTFLARLGNITNDFQNPLGNVPTIVFDGIFREEESKQAEINFKKEFCSKIKSQNLKACQEADVPKNGTTCSTTVPIPQLMIAVLTLLGIQSMIKRAQ